MIQTSRGRKAVLKAFDALNELAICDPVGHRKGRTMVCAVCQASNGDPHSSDCQVGKMLSLINEFDIPAFPDRDKWIADAPKKNEQCKFTLNDKEYNTTDTDLSYDDILTLTGQTGVITVTYRKNIKGDVTRSGILSPGSILHEVDGMIINAYDTSSA